MQKANLDTDEMDAVIVGFNVGVDDEVKNISSKIKVIQNEIVYKLIEDLVEWRKQRQIAIEKKKLMGLSVICKLELLPQYIFRNTKPAIFGVRVAGGKLISGLSMIDQNNAKVGKIKNIQSNQKSVHEALEGTEVAISISGLDYERQLEGQQFLYTNLGESQFKEFKKNKKLLSMQEIQILKEIAELKRKKESEWGI